MSAVFDIKQDLMSDLSHIGKNSADENKAFKNFQLQRATDSMASFFEENHAVCQETTVLSIAVDKGFIF